MRVKFLYSPDSGAAQPLPGKPENPSTYVHIAAMWKVLSHTSVLLEAKVFSWATTPGKSTT